ncbi:MAG: hypothetical protein IPP64_13785 [Bacteroidetes bacterium]|nr:hypothetical protein [Bacteroidota bacterium]
MKKITFLGLALASTVMVNAQVSTFSFTGGMQTYTVPAGVTAVTVTCSGGQGGSGATGNSSAGATLGGPGGLGAMTTGVLAVTLRQD